MCENIKVAASGGNYEDAMLDAMLKCKDVLGETDQVFRDPGRCGHGDWFLKHSDTEPSMGGTLVGGTFIFTRNYDETEYHGE